MSLWQAIQGAQVELAAIPSPLQKIKRLGQISRLFVSEIIGTIALAPYARRALSIYKSTPAPEAFCSNNVHQVYVAKEVRYGDAPRNTMDIWLPSEAAAVTQQGSSDVSSSSIQASRQGQHLPVVVFVHGGG